MSAKTYFKATKFIFALVALLHLSRIVMGWSMVVGGWEVPWWLSVVGFCIASYIAYNGYKLSKKK